MLDLVTLIEHVAACEVGLFAFSSLWLVHMAANHDGNAFVVVAETPQSFLAAVAVPGRAARRVLPKCVARALENNQVGRIVGARLLADRRARPPDGPAPLARKA